MGILYLVATPIGNLEDITIRAIKTLFSVDFVACEDTRKTGQLIKYLVSSIWYQVLIKNNFELKKPQFISYYDEIETKRIPEIVNLLLQEKDVALVSDNGTPLISDPGYKLVKECLKRGIKVVSIPGPSSILTALTSSGLPTNQFLFLGYFPENKNKRLKRLKNLLPCFDTSEHGRYREITIIFFETPHRLNNSLNNMKEVFGDIEIVICREQTKMHEETWRGKISQAISYFAKPKGEFVLLFNILQE